MIGDHTAIEVKSSKRISNADAKGLKALSEERAFKRLVIVSRDEIAAQWGAVKSMHWELFLKKLWGHKLLPL